MLSSASCDVCKEGSYSMHRIKPRGQVMDFGYRLCLWVFFLPFFLFFPSWQLETEPQWGAHWCVGSEALRAKPCTRATLSHALMRHAFCSTVLLLLPFMHSLALAGAGTRRETRVAQLLAGDSHPPLSVSAKYLQVQLPPWSPSGGYGRCFFPLLWIYLDNSSTASAFWRHLRNCSIVL